MKHFSYQQLTQSEFDFIFEKLFTQASIGALVIDMQGVILKVNNSLSKMLHFESQELQSINIQGISFEAHFISSLEHISHTDLQNNSYYLEKTFLTKTNQQKNLLIVVHPILVNYESYYLLQFLNTDALKHNEYLLKLALESSDQGMWDWNIKNHCFHHDQHYASMLGYENNEVVHVTQTQLLNDIHPDDLKNVLLDFEANLTGLSVLFDIEFRLKNKFNQYIWVNSRGRVYERENDGSPCRMIGTHTDITSRKMLEERIERFYASTRENEAKLSALLNFAPDAILTLNNQGYIQSINPSGESLFGYELPDLHNQPIRSLIPHGLPIFADSSNQECLIITKEWLKNHIGKNIELKGIHRNQHEFPIELTINQVEMHSESFWICIIRDISARVEYQKKIHHLAFYDTLTLLPNRVSFYNKLEELYDHPFTLVYIDVNQFKSVNDNLGHVLGDRLLQQIAERIKQSIAENTFLARLGGDEFAILLNTNLFEISFCIVQNILNAINQVFFIEHHEVYLTASIGISVYPENAKDSDVLFKKADIALRYAKEIGKNTYQYYSDQIGLLHEERMNLQGKLQQSTLRLNEDFFLVYQPKIDVKNRKIAGVEALIRWKEPKLGVISPVKFIPLAEETGLIIPIGEWVLNTACKEARRWIDLGYPPLRVAVNLSSVQFNQPNLLDVIKYAIYDAGLDPKLLELELTESVLMQDSMKAIHLLRELRDLGITLSIDDFGTGYSSLNYLKRFPINHIKIDRSFIKDIPDNPDDVMITKTIIALGHNLNLSIIAEGVETIEQCKSLLEYGCHEIQGFYFSQPLNAKDFELYLQKFYQNKA